jgi:hypothetical protein
MDHYLEKVGGFIGHEGAMLAVEIEGQPDFWAFRPKAFAELEGTTTVTATLLDLGDGLMVFVGVGVGGDAASVDLESCADFAAKALASAAAGSRRPNWGEADHALPTPGDQALTVRRPAGWAAFTNSMYDHSVTYFIELLPLWSEQSSASVTIYVGHHADPQTPENSRVEKRKIAGRKVDWYHVQDGELAFGMGTIDGLLRHDVVQIRTATTNPGNAAAVEALVDSLRVGD